MMCFRRISICIFPPIEPQCVLKGGYDATMEEMRRNLSAPVRYSPAPPDLPGTVIASRPPSNYSQQYQQYQTLSQQQYEPSSRRVPAYSTRRQYPTSINHSTAHNRSEQVLRDSYAALQRLVFFQSPNLSIFISYVNFTQ